MVRRTLRSMPRLRLGKLAKGTKRIHGAGTSYYDLAAGLEAAVRLLHVKAFILPAPSSVFTDIANYPKFYFEQSFYTIYDDGGLYDGVWPALPSPSRLFHRNF